MVSDPVLFMANLFLHYYENKWYYIPKKDLRKAHLFSHTIRFIDDLCVINDYVGFDKNGTLRIYILQSCNSKMKTF